MKMKFTFQSIFSSVIFSVVLSLGFIGGVEAADTWMTRIGHIHLDYHEGGIVQNSSGGFAIAGTYYRGDGEKFGGLALLDSDGNLTSVKEYRPGYAETISYINTTESTSPGYLLVMSTSNYNQVWVGRVDEQGNITTNSTGGHLEFYLDMHIEFSVVIDDKAYLVTDAALNEMSGISVVKIDLNSFGIEWARTYNFELDSMNVRSVEKGPKGGPVIVGWTYPNEDLDSYILEISADQGDAQSFNVIGRPVTDKVRDVAVLKDGSLVLAGDGTNVNTADRYDVWVVKINPDMTIGWQKMLGGPNTDWCNSVSVLADNSIVVGATSRSWSPNGEYDFWGIRLKDKGDQPKLRWQKYYWTVDRDETYDQVSTPDGGVVLAAEHHTYTGDTGTILVKTDRRGNVYTTDSYGVTADCPCESKSDAEMIDTDASIHDMKDLISVFNHEETGFIWEETTPVDITWNIPIGEICR